MSPEFVKVANVADVPERRSKRVVVEDEEIALWRVDGKFFAINNVCSHQHFSSLHQGILNGATVSCPMHGWTYSLETGIALTGSGRVKTYEVRVERGEVFVRASTGRDTAVR